MTDIRLTRQRIEIDGVPSLVMAGEVHYFRTPRERWEERIAQVADAGLDTLSTYIPWIWHELPDRTIDLDGRTLAERDVAGFLDLCGRAGLRVFARPGPFVMAELKNEGIPYRVASDDPSLRPRGWNGDPAPTRTLDYLAPGFLAAVDEWYSAILPVLATRQLSGGGPVMGVQLDNEVGMLDWVSNTPALSDLAVTEFAATGGVEDIRSGGTLGDHHELGRFTRARFARYLRHLEQRVREAGIEVPLLINVHGTGGFRGLTFPIGVSQLAQAYRGRDDVFAGSDYYLGELTVQNVADLYVCNAVLASVNGADQPASSLEFEAGRADYGEDLDHLASPESTVLKTLLTVAQGSRMVNYYLFAGGINPELPLPRPDGTGRLAFTGERHGTSAPITPEGETTREYDALRSMLTELRSNERLLAAGREEHDDMVLGFVADAFLTEYSHPDASDRAEQVADTSAHRLFGVRSTLARALVLGGFRFPAVDLQAAAAPTSAWAGGASIALDPSKAVVLATGRTLGAEIQGLLASFVLDGGRLLLVGALPDRDDDGSPCTALADALGVRSAGRLADAVTADSEFWPTVATTGPLGDGPEVRVSRVQLFDSPDATVLMRERDSGAPSGVLVTAGAGRAVLVGADYPVHLRTWRRLLDLVDVRPGITTDSDGVGLVATTVAHDADRLLVAVNVAPHPLDLEVRVDGVPLPDRLVLPARGHALVPLGRSQAA